MGSDFDFYGDSTDDAQAKSIKGITDTISEYSFTKFEYPCLVIKRGFTCPKHKMSVISNMVQSSSKLEKDISLYFTDTSGEVFKLGMLAGIQVSAFLDMIKVENIIGFFEDKKLLEGDLLYVLSGS